MLGLALTVVWVAVVGVTVFALMSGGGCGDWCLNRAGTTPSTNEPDVRSGVVGSPTASTRTVSPRTSRSTTTGPGGSSTVGDGASSTRGLSKPTTRPPEPKAGTMPTSGRVMPAVTGPLARSSEPNAGGGAVYEVPDPDPGTPGSGETETVSPVPSVTAEPSPAPVKKAKKVKCGRPPYFLGAFACVD